MKSPLQNIFLQITSYILDQTRKSCVRTVDSGDEWRLAGFFFTFRFFFTFSGRNYWLALFLCNNFSECMMYELQNLLKNI